MILHLFKQGITILNHQLQIYINYTPKDDDWDVTIEQVAVGEQIFTTMSFSRQIQSMNENFLTVIIIY